MPVVFGYLLYTIAKENGEGSGESSFAAVEEKIMQQTGIWGILVLQDQIRKFSLLFFKSLALDDKSTMITAVD